MSAPLWTLEEMRQIMAAKLVSCAETNTSNEVTGISIDTRTLQQGDAYFAIKGDVHDGHKFVAAAAKNGATVAVVSKDKLAGLGEVSISLLVVDEVLPALEKLGCASRARSKAKIIAVTGSVGKTTSKEALRQALEPSGKVHASVASYNNHWGVPLTLARMPEDCDFAVFEIGMNHANEITPLVAMVRPQVVLITTIEAAHLGAFNSLSEIADAKAEIFSGLEPGGTAILNRDNDYFDQLEKSANAIGVETIVSFGESPEADARLLKVKLHGVCSCMTASICGQQVAAKIGAPGRHMVQNALGVLAAVHVLGADMARASIALAALGSVKGRGERHEVEIGDATLTLIDESYNANPASMRASLDVLAQSEPGVRGRRIAVLGDMLELGETSKKLHEELEAPLADAGVDLVFLAGKDMAVLHDAIKNTFESHYSADTNGLISALVPRLRKHDVVMVKSSLGLNFRSVVDAILNAYPSKNTLKEQIDSPAIGN